MSIYIHTQESSLCHESHWSKKVSNKYPLTRSNITCLFLFIGNENNKKIRSFSICYSISAQLLAKQVCILLTTSKFKEKLHKCSNCMHLVDVILEVERLPPPPLPPKKCYIINMYFVKKKLTSLDDSLTRATPKEITSCFQGETTTNSLNPYTLATLKN